jgi:hypothetical protein
MSVDSIEKQATLESSGELYSAISDALNARTQRDRDQALWYELTKRGWRRRHKPFPGCADYDIKLADSMLEGVKPSYYAAIRGGDSLFRFTGLDTDSVDSQDDAAYLLDDRLNYHSNFNKFVPSYIHACLQSGVGMAKEIWNVEKGENDFSVVPPEYWVVPEETDEVQDADWFVHIMQLSVDQFMRDERFKAECRTEDYVNNIKGTGNPYAVQRRQAKCRREGLTYSDDKNRIVLWEIWERTDAGAWMYSTKVPSIWTGQEDDEEQDPMMRATVRDLMLSPYQHGRLPFVPMKFEQPEEGIYAPRGIPELTATYQTGAVKALNQQQDRLTFVGTPCFSADREVPGASNITLTPGIVVPFPVKVLDMGSVPIDYEKQINLMRELAEWRISTPDFGVVDENGGARTAREMSLRAQESQQGSNIRVTLMRNALQELGFMAWENLRQFDRSSLDYIRDGELQTADAKVWDGKYRIEPGGAVDGSSKLQQMQQAQANIEVGEKMPFVALDQIVGDYYGLQGPSLRKRYILDQGEKAQSEMERQATELTDMVTIGFPIHRKPWDVDVAHITAIGFYLAALQQKNTPPTPESAMLILQHGQEHEAALKGTKDPNALKVMQQIQPLVLWLSSIIQQGQQQPPNVLAMPSGSAGAPAAAAQAPMDPKTAAAIGNAIAAMVKAGIPISLDQINGVYADLKLPPVDGSSPILRDPGSAMKPQGTPVPMPQPAMGGAM